MHTLRFLWTARHENAWERRKNRLSRRKQNVQGIIPDDLFIEHFRLNKNTFRQLCRDLRDHTSLRGSSEISLESKVLCTLSFLAKGSYQKAVGISQHMTQRTTSRCIRQVVEALNHHIITKKWINYPQTLQERSEIKESFQREYNLPGVIGCIDCTHIPIIKPAENEQAFFNGKGYYSLNVQIVCDHNLRIINVNSKFGGATHDSHIWSASQVEPYMRGLHENGEYVWLLGDSGYPQRPWLMTPVLKADRGSREEEYTLRHGQARASIERCFSLLKSRWRCLRRDRTLHYHPYIASKIILACCVLHNIAVNAQLPPPLDMEDVANDDSFDTQDSTYSTSNETELMTGRAMLTSLISRI